MTKSIVEKLRKPNGSLGGASPQLLEILSKARVYDRPFIGGRFRDPLSKEVFANVTPINGDKINDVALCDERDVDLAVQSAKSAFRSGSWSRSPKAKRREVVLNIAALLEKHMDELSALDALDVGKPFSMAKGVDLSVAVETFRWYGELIDKVEDRIAPTDGLDLILREPFGVVGAVTPWNYPLMLIAWKIAPMLAAGNSVVLKPAEQSPLSALRFAELVMEAGLPEGVLNVVPGDGPRTGAAIGLHNEVDALGFTGSSEVGKKFLEYAGRSNMKPAYLECGGKSPVIVFDDSDAKRAAEAVASAVFYNAGQSCNAPARAVVHRAVAEEFTKCLMDQAAAYQPDNAFKDGATVGAIVSEEQLRRVQGFVERAVKDRARLRCGGKRMHEGSRGWYFAPTVLDQTNQSMEVNQEEIFGPVVPVQTFESVDEAISIANDTRYGLWANVWTNRLDVALKVGRAVRAGTVALNTVWGGDIRTPMGGYKESGLGRDRGIEGMTKYMQTKHLSL